MIDPMQEKPIPTLSPSTDTLLEHHLVNADQNAKNTHTLLEHHLINNDKNAKIGHSLAENHLEMQGKTKDSVDEAGNKVADAVKELKPVMDAAGFIQNFMAAIKGDKGEDSTIPGPKGETGERGESGIDGRTPIFTGQKEPSNPQLGDIWYKN